MRRLLCGLLLASGLGGAGAAAEEAPTAPAAAPVPAASATPVFRALQESAPVRIRDSRGAQVTLRVPTALHRPANAYRLYGMRPLTLWGRDRRKDLYRDAFLELATRSRLGRAATAWDSLPKQMEWLGAAGVPSQVRQSLSDAVSGAGSAAAGVSAAGSAQLASLLPPAVENAGKAASDLARRVMELPGRANVQALVQGLAQGQTNPELTDPVAAALTLRALATDQAEERLLLLGQVLNVEGPGVDPALRDGYRAARAEFSQVRQGLWPAVAASVRKNQGRLLVTAVKQIVLSNLGFWAIFGHLGWQSAEAALNAEYRGQYSVCLATLAASLEGTPGTAARPLALYTEYALSHQLTEALKTGQVMALKPAGGRGAAEWQILLSDRCRELRLAFEAPPATQATAVTPPAPIPGLTLDPSSSPMQAPAPIP